jgi:hypothetical protein
MCKYLPPSTDARKLCMSDVVNGGRKEPPRWKDSQLVVKGSREREREREREMGWTTNKSQSHHQIPL